jgi:hypothetical protein
MARWSGLLLAILPMLLLGCGNECDAPCSASQGAPCCCTQPLTIKGAATTSAKQTAPAKSSAPAGKK